MTMLEARWPACLSYDPLPALLRSGNLPVEVSARKALLHEDVAFETLWELPEVRRILKAQSSAGSWAYRTPQTRAAAENYDQYESFKKLGILIERYGFDRRHPSIQQAGEYFFSCQSAEGDFRGIYDRQYTPNYTAGIAELLIRAGYTDEARIERVFQWLLSMRQDDGGWALPFRTQGYGIDVTYRYPETIQPDRTQPFSHMVTGVVLRAFASHPHYRNTPEAMRAGELLASRLFERDSYPDRRAPTYWLQFTFPFCYTDLVSALDSLTLLGFSADEPRIGRAVQWLIDHQSNSGLWELKITAGGHPNVTRLWLTLAICKLFQRLYP